MSEQHDPASATDVRPTAGWVMSEGQGRPARTIGLRSVLVLLGLPLMAVLAYGTLHIWSAAASDCEVFEAGDRFGVIFIVWPAFSFVLWVAYSLPILLVGRRSVRIGLALGLIVVTVMALWFVSGTADMIRASADSYAPCPFGVPAWWPTILPH